MARRMAPLAGAALAALVVAVPAGAQAPPVPQTLTVTEAATGGTFGIVDNAPRSRRHGRNQRFSIGDALVITSRVLDGSRKRIGTARAVCFVTKAGGFDRAESDCVGVFALTTGNLYVTAPLKFSGTSTTGSVVGGTGAYQGLHGT